MNEVKARDLVNKIFNNVFLVNCNFSLEEILEKFAFDLKLDSFKGESLLS